MCQTFIALNSSQTPRFTLGTVAQVKAMVALLNSCGALPLESEVVIAVPTLHLLSTKAMIRSDIAIAAEVRTFVIIGIRRCKNDILQQPPMAISELGCCFQCRLWCLHWRDFGSTSSWCRCQMDPHRPLRTSCRIRRTWRDVRCRRNEDSPGDRLRVRHHAWSENLRFQNWRLFYRTVSPSWPASARC